MPLTVDSIIQETTGTQATTTAGATVSLPAGTTAGNTVIAVLQQGFLPSGVAGPSGWVIDATVGSTSNGLVVARKSNVTAGETSWAFTNTSSSSEWAWYACEIAGLDVVDPLDASATQADTTVATGGTTVGTGTTAANSGTDTLVFACFGCKGPTTGAVPTWGSYSAGYSEAGQIAITGNGTINGENVAVARSWSGGATTGPFTASAVSSGGGGTGHAAIVAYRASDSPVVNPLTWQLGFEHGTHNGLFSTTTGGTSPAATGATLTVGTDVILQASSARAAPSSYGCRIVASASSKYLQASAGTHFPSTAKNVSLGLDVRVVSGSGTVVVAALWPASGTTLQLVYDVTGTRYGLRWGASGTVSWQAGTTALNTWAWVDVRMTGITTATWHADWRLETGASTYTDQTSPADLTGQTSGTSVAKIVFGGETAQTSTMDLDNVVLSIYASAFPLGPHTLQPVKVDPAGTPTVSGTVGNFALVTSNATGAALTTGTLTSARDAIDELPPTISASSDGVVQTTAAATDYLQFPMDTFTVGSAQVIAGVRMLACLISTTGAGAGNLGIRGWDGTNEASLMALVGVTPGSSTTVGNAVPPWGAYMWNPVGGWTQAKLDAAALRVGFSSDATPDMGVHAMYLEVATRPALTARQLSVEDDLFTTDVVLSPYTSASVSYVVTSSDASRGVTFDYSLAGVPQTSVYVAANTSTTVSVAADLFGDVDSVTLTPDPA